MFNSIAKTEIPLNTFHQRGSYTSATPISYAYFLIALACLLLLTSKVLLAADIIMTDVRVHSKVDHTRLTFESNSPIQYALSMLDSPGRVVIDLEQVVLTPVIKSLSGKIIESDPYIRQIRIGQYKPHILRLVLDLKTAVVPRSFVLSPEAGTGHRLVVDIYEIGKAARVEQPQAEYDRLGNFVGKLNKPEYRLKSKRLKPWESEAFKIAKRHKPSQKRMMVVAIDAGHGGKDPGALGPRGTREKDVTLSIARKLKARIDKEPNMRAVLIRDGDYYVALHKRRNIARRKKADLFVSIHADAFHKKSARGSSVFALSHGAATSTAARWIARKENSVDRKWVGGVNLENTGHEVQAVIVSLVTHKTMLDSLSVGEHILDELGDINHLHKSHVEQAGFAVLKSPDIPSVLVETAFLSNPKEEQKLKSNTYQNKMADALHSGIKRYFAANPALVRSLAQAK